MVLCPMLCMVLHAVASGLHIATNFTCNDAFLNHQAHATIINLTAAATSTHYNVTLISSLDGSTNKLQIVHISVFSFDEKASFKVPEASTSTKLLDEYLVDGFVTSSEPLLVKTNAGLVIAELPVLWQGGVEQPLKHLSLGYLKGQARVLTVLAVLSLCLENGVDLGKAGPLFDSALLVAWWLLAMKPPQA